MTVDVLAIGAHPDDIELSCGGTVAKFVADGHSVALADATGGELGSRGTAAIRASEAQKAGAILGAKVRKNLGFPDGSIEVTQKSLLKVITLIRELRPRILLIPHGVDRHPDHVHAHQLCKEGWFYSGLHKIKTSLKATDQEAYRPENFFEFMQWFEFDHTFVVDISSTFEKKMESIRAHASQFHNPESSDPQTRLSQPDFLQKIEARAGYYGQTIGVRYGEPFFSFAPVGIRSMFDLVLSKR
jgi:bacillithiol biosynthesis deacetylase BshB1